MKNTNRIIKIACAALALSVTSAAVASSQTSANPLKTSSMTESCPMQIDFSDPAAFDPWRAINDGVMGGRSSGGPSQSDGFMVFDGIINTNGGGFSSIRRSAEPGDMAGTDGMIMRVRGDGRGYKLSLRTNARFRFRPIAFQAPIPVTSSGEWQNVFVSFDDLRPSIFGRPLRGAEFDVSEVREIGVIISDGIDGPFRLDIAQMRACEKPIS